MRKVLIVGLAWALLPLAAAAQTEVGLDAGLTLNLRSPTNITTFSIPTQAVRVAFPVGQNGMLLETMATFNLVDAGGTFTTLNLLPGIVHFLANEGGRQTYLRGEAGFQRTSGGGASATQWILGGAAGIRREIQPGVMWRLEGGIDRWFDPGFTQLRALFGVTFVLD